MKYLFGSNAFDYLNEFISTNNYSKVFILTDDHTKKFSLPLIDNYFSHEFTNVNIPVGDKNKNIDTLKNIWEELLEKGGDRKSLLINLGGGVVTDIGGFAAVSFKRGIDFIHIPTTLLGMVDAAIGGKNGINFKGYKNQIGTIVPPKFVIIFPEFLKTLPPKEFDSGFAEMLKHGLIADHIYWNELLAYENKQANDPVLLDLIKKSIEIKEQIITSDPHELGLRKVLNFGHTLGHAIESYLNYYKKNYITHGHAVAIGMILAVYLSTQITNFPFSKALGIKKIISNKYPYISFNKKDREKIIDLLSYDKKNINGQVYFVLLTSIGKPVINQIVPKEKILKAFDFYA